MAAHVSDFSKLPKQVLLDLINEHNGTNLPETAVQFGTPALTGRDAIQTRITVSATPRSGYKGSVEFTYNRVNLSFMGTNEPDLVIETNEVNMHAMISFLNTTFGINLTVDDIEDSEIPPQEPDVNSFVPIIAKSGSLVWAGHHDLTFTLPLVELSSIITIPILNGLYPNPAAIA